MGNYSGLELNGERNVAKPKLVTEDAERSEKEGIGGRNKKAFLPSIQRACPGVTGALDKEEGFSEHPLTSDTFL